MPSATHEEPPAIPVWEQPGKTSENLDWSDVKVIDLSTFDEPGGKYKLAEDLRDAVQHTGFFSIIRTGFTQEEIDCQYDIGQAYFNLPIEEKGNPGYLCNFTTDNYSGYRAPHEKKTMSTDVLDNVKSVKIPKFIPENKNEPFHPYLRQFQPAIQDFRRRSLELASKVFILFSIILELPEDYFSNQHLYNDPS